MPEDGTWGPALQTPTFPIALPENSLTPADFLVLPEEQRDRVLQERFQREYGILLDRHFNQEEVRGKLEILREITTQNYDENSRLFDPLRSKAIVLVHPARCESGLKHAYQDVTRSSRPERNKIGDLRWMPDKGGTFFYTPIVDAEMTEVAKPIGQWSYQETLQALYTAVDTVFPNQEGIVGKNEALMVLIAIDYTEREWDKIGLAGRLRVVNRKLRALQSLNPQFREEGLEAGSLLDAVSPTESKTDGETKVGIEVIEYDQNGEVVEEFMLFLEKLTPGNYMRLPDWAIRVVCRHGDEETYAFGETEMTGGALIRKPVIYIYPEQTTEVSVGLDFTLGDVVVEYPERSEDGKWHVFAEPDGTLISMDKKKEYKYLFWEGEPDVMPEYDMSEGFCVAGDKAVEFLEEKLSILGLNDAEKEDFITYWYPVMKRNKFNMVKFLTEEYTDTAKLDINPKPDTLTRVFMAFKASSAEVDIKEQELTAITRKGYTVVEWGGVNLDERVK